jgi:rare lipoprotein A
MVLHRLFFAFALVAGGAAGSASAQSAASARSAEIVETEPGHAVRYDPGATGQATASGEPYNPERMTVAHPTLPFGTLVELVNDANGQRVTARVNDRMPDLGTLRIRVSARTADQLGLGARGGAVTVRLDEDEVAFLRVRAMREKERALAARPRGTATAVEGRGFTVQIASFSDEARATARADELRGAWVLPVEIGPGVVYRVCYGVFPTSERAAISEASLRRRGIEGFVKSLDAPPMRTTTLGSE